MGFSYAISRKFEGDAVMYEGDWYHCLRYPCANVTKWRSLRWNSHICPSCMIKERRQAARRALTGGEG